MHKAVVISISIVWTFFGTFGLIAIPLAVMAFDAPGSEKNPTAYVIAIGMTTFPIACLASAILSWASLWDNAIGKAYVWLLLPLANIAIIVAAQTFVDLFQTGRLNG